MPYTVRYMYLIVLVLLDKVDALTCGYENITDNKIEAEGSFANISQIINVTNTLDATVFFEVCRNNSLENGCRFVWRSQSREMTVRNQRVGVLCFWKHRNLSLSMFTFELHASYLVERSLSIITLSLMEKDSKPETLKIMRLLPTYPPKVTNLTVNEQEVRDTHLINKGEEVRVACFSDVGNPPAVFRLIDKNGKELAVGQGRLTYAFSARCEDDWPRVYCEGNGSKQNRSVSFLVRCPAQFVDSSKVVSLSASAITFRVKAHTTVIKECHLTPISANDSTKASVDCALQGSPPDLVLNLYAENDKILTKGPWMVTIRNEKGSTNTSFVINTATTLCKRMDMCKGSCGQMERNALTHLSLTHCRSLTF